MQRIAAIGLLVSFLLQTSGAALAGQSRPTTPSLRLDLAATIAAAGLALQGQLESSRIFAQLTGTTSLYNAIHAPAPKFKHGAKQLISPGITHVAHNVPITVLHGTRATGPKMLTSPVLPKNAPKDPLATHHARAAAAEQLASSSHAASSTSRTVATTSAATRSPLLLTPKPYITVSPTSVSGASGGYTTVTITCWTWDGSEYAGSDCSGTYADTITSTNAAVATGSGDTVTFVGAGTATLTYEYTGASGLWPTLSVTVTASTPSPSPSPSPSPTPSPTPEPTPCPPGWTGTAPSCSSPGSSSTPAPRGTALPATLTGINHYWTYEEGAIPGVGKWMVNVANGNMLVQDDDIDVPERGIDLAFRRTYNSQSHHDWSNSDGSVPSMEGNGWTSTFDAHLGLYTNGSSAVMSVYDIDGARYDYTADGSGDWTPPAGMHNTLTWDGSCGYLWTKTDGTVYYFYRPDLANCGDSSAGYDGRLYEIYERNNNNWVRLDYSWNGYGPAAATDMTAINAVHADGQQLVLTYGASGSQVELASVERPDGATVTFGYDSSGNLTDVWDIGNNAATGATAIHHQYGYATAGTDGENGSATGYMMDYANSANWVASSGSAGAYIAFSYDGNNNNGMDEAQYSGVVNTIPSDGTSTALQSGYTTSSMVYRDEFFDYSGDGETDFTDTDGHDTNYMYDGSSRVTETEDWNGSEYLVSTATWDSNDNLTSTVDPRGAATGSPSTYETDYAYDSNGNMIVQALPSVSTTAGTTRPTSIYAYDSYNNVTAYCDPVESAALSISGVGTPSTSESTCAGAGPGSNRYTYSFADGYEPFGMLVESKSACVGSCGGEDKTYSYSAGAQGGDFGLPTEITEPCFTQYDSSEVCPQQNFSYDTYGNLTSYNKGNGATTVGYDALNRISSVSDPDGVTTRRCYFEDGSLAATQTAAQYAADSDTVCGSHSVSYTYDADGNKLTEVHHYNDESGTTTNWYDGDDRLVEVELPHDTSDQYSYAWLTRSIYDISQNSGVTIGGTSGLYAHGNLFKTEEYVGVTSDTPAWNDLKGDTYDAMDREVSHYAYEPGTSTLEHSTNAYDQTTATAALLTTATDALGEVKTPTYNAAGTITETAYSGDGGVTPSETVTVDPDARPATVTSSSMGEMSTTYDKDGKVTEVQEPSGGSVTSPAEYTYSYYTDGQRSGLSVSSTTLTQSNMLQYAYRTDGLRAKLAFADGAVSASWAWTQSDAGRTTAIADSSGQATRTITYDAYGRTATDTMPAGEMSSFTYDDEGEVTGYSFPPMDGSTSTTLAYTARGEFVSETFAGGSSCPIGSDATLDALYTSYANGVPIPGGACGSTTTWDKRTGAITYTGSSTNNTNPVYDAAGRQNSSLNPWSVSWTCGDGECGGSGYGERTRTYDAENHLIGDAYTDWSVSGLSGCMADKVDPPHDQIDGISGTMAYNWGPNGHPDRWVGGIGFTALTLHWDGDTPLFITDNSGTLEEIKIEGLGFYAPSATTPMTFIDRDQSGFVVAAHWNGGTGPWTASNPFHQSCDGEGISGYALFEPGSDGITDTVNTIQGARSYDPALGTWTSPDAYAGDASDPMSRKSFMWNKNNAYIYSDPTGFQEEEREPGEDAADELLIEGEARDQNLQRASRSWARGTAPSPMDNMINHTSMEKHGADLDGMNEVEITDAFNDLFSAATNNISMDSDLLIIDKPNGSYAVYQKSTGYFGVYEADGKIISAQNLLKDPDGPESKKAAETYVKSQGKQVLSVPCTIKDTP